VSCPAGALGTIIAGWPNGVGSSTSPKTMQSAAGLTGTVLAGSSYGGLYAWATKNGGDRDGFPNPVSGWLTSLADVPVWAGADGVYEAGSHELVWDGVTGEGARAASGVYFCPLETGGIVDVRKMVLLR